MTEHAPFDAANWTTGVRAVPALVDDRRPVGAERSPGQIVDTFVAFAAASVGDGAVFWPAEGRFEVDWRPRVCHPDGDMARMIKSGLSLPSHRSTAPDLRPRHEVLRDVLLDITPAALVVPVDVDGAELGHLGVFSLRPTARYGPADHDLLTRVAVTAAAALQHAEVRSHPGAGGSAVVEADPRHSAGPAGDHRRLLDRMAELEDEERRALGEAIHDAPIQQIVTGVVRLEYLRDRVDQHGQQVIDGVTDLLEESLDWLRSLIVVSLTPPDLAPGIGPALAVLARQVLAGTGTRVRIAGPAHANLDRSAKLAVYRIFREALLNVARHAEADLVVIRVESRAGEIEISLRDNGVGGVDGKPAGSRGLSMMADRARNQGAELVIDSPPRGGTTVTVRFRTSVLPVPVSPGALAAASLAAPPLVSRARNRVLVCDDQKDLRAAVTLVLADNPTVEVVGEAPDGDTCLRLLEERRPDVLIVDVSMPGGGPDLARAIKTIRPDCHVIVFSGRADAATQEAMLEAGADQYVVKSGRLRRLIEALERAI
ncbi:response regulator [Nakamurella flava]|uniref:Response regulator n=1 Tax=Nakamurella flava TaxID=2576308 RepID=A0A4V6CVF9_9ACTN|nr:response regulator [Nakamurella flava]TKV57345.1 response regulator [Nakamurella flava]